jgi:hypothetical protein
MSHINFPLYGIASNIDTENLSLELLILSTNTFLDDFQTHYSSSLTVYAPIEVLERVRPNSFVQLMCYIANDEINVTNVHTIR